MEKKGIIHTDGGARGNPGPAGIGVVIEFGGQKKLFKKFIGHATNNQAEYEAVILSLEKAEEFGLEILEIYLDSELVERQLNKKYRVKDKDLAPLFVKAWNFAMGFKKVTYHHIYREDNKEADKLVNQAINEVI